MRYGTLVTLSFVASMFSSAAMGSSIKFGTALAPIQSAGQPGTGWSSIEFDLDTHDMLIRVGFTGLRGNSSAATVNGPTASPNTGSADAMTALPSLAGFPLGVHSATYEHLFDMDSASSYNPAFLNNAANHGDVVLAFNSLVTALTDDKSYLDLKSTQLSGALKGFYKVVPPTPESTSLAAGGLLLALRRRR